GALRRQPAGAGRRERRRAGAARTAGRGRAGRGSGSRRMRLAIVLGASIAGVAVLASLAGAARSPVIVVDPGHDAYANLATEPIGPGSSFRNGWTDDIYAASKRAATIVQSEEVRALGFPDAGLQERTDYTGFNWSNVPAILVEMGFMTNPTEDRLLATAVYEQRAAVGLCRGTLRFLRRSDVRCG